MSPRTRSAQSSLQNWCEKNGQKFEDWWQNPQAERYHFIGKAGELGLYKAYSVIKKISNSKK